MSCLLWLQDKKGGEREETLKREKLQKIPLLWLKIFYIVLIKKNKAFCMMSFKK